MAGFVEGVDRGQRTLFPALLDDYVAEDNPVRVVRFLPRNLPRQRAFEIGNLGPIGEVATHLALFVSYQTPNGDLAHEASPFRPHKSTSARRSIRSRVGQRPTSQSITTLVLY
jgi:hypothetical protein